MKPFICRVGSKRDIADKIIEMFPDHTTYIEPFIGGGAIFWKKDPSPIEIINDLDSDIADTYKIIKKTKLEAEDFPSDLNTLPKLKKWFDNPVENEADFLTYQIISYCNSFGSRGTTKSSGIYKPSNPYAKTKKIDAYRDRLKNVKILNQSYEKVIKKYDSEDTFVYLDPPYVDSKQLYKHGAFDFEKLAKTLSKMKGKFLMSINDDPYIREVFSDFYQKKIVIKAKGNKSIGAKDRPELLILNY
jgi:DNA adenine methylase